MKSLVKKWQKELFAVYDKVRKEKSPHEIKVDGIDMVVLPNVFSPKYFVSGSVFAGIIRKIVKQKSLLEIGTGSGIVALFCALNGAKVVATDINPAAVKNTKLNFKKYKLRGSIRLGNVYDPIKRKEKFDYIFWNHPFNNWHKPVKDVLLQAGFDYKYRGLNEYIASARKHLLPKGRLLLGTGNFSDLAMIKKIAKKNNYSIKLLEKIIMSIERGAKSKIKNEFIIYEFVGI